MLFSVGLFDFDWTYANFNPHKTYKTRDSVFPQLLTTAWHGKSDVEFYAASNDNKHMTAPRCTKKFYKKNLEKIVNIQKKL